MADAKDLLGSVQGRLVGPFRGGRCVAVAGDPVDPLTFYFGACAGGVWKSQDAGASWQNVSDGFFNTAAIGAVAVAASDRNVVYAGTGEACIRGNVSHGDGVYKSTDGGASWKNVGLSDTRHIARVRIHPDNPDVVYVAALGHAFGPHPDRGIFRSRDGGKTWHKVLYRDENTGASDLTMDPHNPRVLYAGLWQARRYPWALESGGEGSGLFKTTDGGDTWQELTNNPGLPAGLKGRIGVAVSPARPDRVWAIVEAKEGGLFRSDDGGSTWQLVSDNPDLRQRPWYYMHIFADPQDPDVMYVLNLRMWKSHDGGKSFSQIPTPHGDNHDLWIDPQNPRRMVQGNDGGANVSFDGGVTWSSIYNQPTAQFYHVTTDNQFPYRIYGAQQDNTTISVPSYSDRGAITADDTYPIGGGESGYIAVHPDNPNVTFAGSYASRMTRYDHASGQEIDITVWPEDPIGYGAESLKYRVQWTFPIALSKHDPNVLYTTSQHVHRSTDGGMQWDVISPDLTIGDPETLRPSGGPITKDNVSTETYATVFAFAESPGQRGVLWTGSDDGFVHVSRDDGATWQNVTPPQTLVPMWALISIIEPSPHDAATAYVAATRYKLDDTRPYLLKTHDYGQTWELITNGFRQGDFTRTVREDPKQRGLLYAGTETGVYVSFDEGGSWQPLTGNLPVVPIHDLIVHGDSLVLATHGRAFWTVDDLSPIRAAAGAASNARARLFPMAPTYRMRHVRLFPTPEAVGYKTYVQTGGSQAMGLVVSEDGQRKVKLLNAGENPPNGAAVTYAVNGADSERVSLTFLTADGREIRRFSSADADGPGKQLAKSPGVHRFVWDLRYPDATKLENTALSAYWGGSTIGPEVVPGTYQVRLEVDGQTVTERFEVVEDPRSGAGQQDLQAQFDLLLAIRDRLTEVHEAVVRSRRSRQQLAEWQGRLRAAEKDDLAEEAKRVSDRLLEAENELVESRSRGRADSFNYPPKVNSKLASLQSTVAWGHSRPPQQCYEVFDMLSGQAGEGLARLQGVFDTEVAGFNRQLVESGVPVVG